MTRRIRWWILPLLLLAVGCRGVVVDATHDAAADFSAFKTFGWAVAPLSARTAIDDATIVELVAAELRDKGLEPQSERPDLLVAVHRSLRGRLHTRDWNYSFEGGRLREHEMQEGTLVVDLVDPVSLKSVWRGTAAGAFRADLTDEEREELIRDILSRMFRDYPPSTAG